MKKLLLILFQVFLLAGTIEASKQDSSIIIQPVKFHAGEIIFPFRETQTHSLFSPYKNQKLKIDSIYWFQVIIESKNIKPQDYYIHFNSMISNINLYQFINDSIYAIKKSGAYVPLNQKESGGYLKDKVSFTLLANKQTILYLRIYNQLENNYSLKNIEIISKAEFEKSTSNLFFLQGGFLGVIIILLLVNFLLFIFSNDKLYLYYSIYLFLIGLFFFNNFQFSERYFFFSYPKIDLMLYWSVYLSQYIYLLFFLELLKNENLPIWRKYVKYYARFILLFFISIIIIGQINFPAAAVFSDIYTLINVIFVIYSFYLFYKRVKPTTKLVLIGSTVMVIGALITTIIDFSKVSVGNLVYYQSGLFVEFILFTIAINYTYINEHLEKLNILYRNSILELEKAQKEKENIALIDEIASKNRGLATKAMILSEKENLISRLIQQLNQLDTNSKNKPAIQNMVNNLKISLTNNSWGEFEKHFNEVHPKFYSGLSKKHPGLTANERKLCAFLKLNLSSKEISAITGKSLNTIDVGRSRLRKKIGLTNEENLHTAIANIS